MLFNQRIPWLLLCLLIATACDDPDIGPSPTPTLEPDYEGRFDIRVEVLSPPLTHLWRDEGDLSLEFPGEALMDEGSWLRASRDVDTSAPFGALFSFNDGTSRVYPGGSYEFRVAGHDAWVWKGLIFPFDPQKEEAPVGDLSILTLNLHTYQEENPNQKLDYIADVIATQHFDLIAFQECAQSRDAEVVDTHLSIAIRADNMVLYLVERLKNAYGLDYNNYFWDWSHYGFTDYEEGLAVMARSSYPMVDHGATYVSNSTSVNDPLSSRKVLFASFDVPGLGRIALLSAHLSWGTEQDAQIANMKAFLDEHLLDVDAAFIAGDFNANAGGTGYVTMLSDGLYEDSYVAANEGTGDAGLHDATMDDGQRIDYVFRHQGLELTLRPIIGQRVFLDLGGAGYGQSSMQRVSDHRGVILRFRLN